MTLGSWVPALLLTRLSAVTTISRQQRLFRPLAASQMHSQNGRGAGWTLFPVCPLCWFLAEMQTRSLWASAGLTFSSESGSDQGEALLHVLGMQALSALNLLPVQDHENRKVKLERPGRGIRPETALGPSAFQRGSWGPVSREH